jgi:hypothetical protein
MIYFLLRDNSINLFFEKNGYLVAIGFFALIVLSLVAIHFSFYLKPKKVKPIITKTIIDEVLGGYKNIAHFTIENYTLRLSLYNEDALNLQKLKETNASKVIVYNNYIQIEDAHVLIESLQNS